MKDLRSELQRLMDAPLRVGPTALHGTGDGGGGPARKTPLPSGHIAPPGTGPEGETCKTCDSLVRRHFSKTYLKCGLNRAAWTGGGKTDVRASDPACNRWSPAKS